MPQNPQHTVVLLNLAANIDAQVRQEFIDRSGSFTLGLVTKQALFRILAKVCRVVMRSIVAFVTAERYQVDVHDGKTRHHETADTSHIGRSINGFEYRDNQIFEV